MNTACTWILPSRTRNSSVAFTGPMCQLTKPTSPSSQTLSTVIFGVLVIGILIPLALAGVPYRTADLGSSLNRNLLLYGVGGLIMGAAGIKLIDLVVALVPGY